jgi:hypothetical protein
LRQPQLARGTAQRARARDREEDAQVAPFHPCLPAPRPNNTA